jgi:AP2 domain
MRWSKSKYHGVRWNREHNRWEARLRFDHGERIHIGYFNRELDAARAYNEEALRRLGQHATLAFIEGEDWLERHQALQPVRFPATVG